jgi:hypothetical protein
MSDQPDTDAVIGLIKERQRHCRIEYIALSGWLSFLTPLRWITIAGGTILSALAGATVLSNGAFLGSAFKIYSGIFALTASILTGLHTALHCDTHQAECRRLIQLYESLELAFQATLALPPSEIPRRFHELEAALHEAKLKATATPPMRYRRRAEHEVPAV